LVGRYPLIRQIGLFLVCISAAIILSEYRPYYLQHRRGKIKQRIFANSSKGKISIRYTGTLAMVF
jgi:hypothetical protein